MSSWPCRCSGQPVKLAAAVTGVAAVAPGVAAGAVAEMPPTWTGTVGVAGVARVAGAVPHVTGPVSYTHLTLPTKPGGDSTVATVWKGSPVTSTCQMIGCSEA